MSAPTGSQPETDQTNAASIEQSVDETAAGLRSSGAAPGFGPPIAAGEVGTLGPYRVVKELGRGGMGAVFAATDTRLDRRVALKVMLPEFAADRFARERFPREARAAARVKHDNVVTVYEADEREGVTYIAMEFLEGFPLDMFLKKKGSPTLAQTLRIAREAAAGLAAAHKLGLVHRDIKPANLWLEAPNGRVKVLDFGLAKPMDAADELTKSGAVVGTPAYMSPEQARGEKVDHRTDLFSLGAVLYRLCTGKLPFTGPSTMAVLMALGTEEPPPVRELNPEIPESLAALIHQLLSKRAEARPQTADEVVKRLRTVTEELAPRALTAEQSTSQPQLVQPQVMYVPIQVTTPPEQSPFADLDAQNEEPTVAASNAFAAPEPKRQKPQVRGPWLVACGALALTALLVCGVIIVIKNKDGTETKIEVPDGATVTVKDKGGKTLASVGPNDKQPAADAGADRRAAEWVLGQGGSVGTNLGIFAAKDANELPKEPFALTQVNLAGTAVTDTGLSHLNGLTSLVEINLNDTRTGDAGLAQLKELKNLTRLSLFNTRVTDAGLGSLAGLKGLAELHLDNTAVGDAGLAHLAASRTLKVLLLSGTKVTDAGLPHLRKLDQLENLSLYKTAVTDAGLKHLRELKNLTVFGIGWTPITDAGLEHLEKLERLATLHLPGTAVTDMGLKSLKNLQKLETLGLAETKVTNAGLEHLKGCKGLTALVLRDTKVTAQGLDAFHAAVPGCRIEHDGGVIEAVDSDREAAEWVIAQGGTVIVQSEDKHIKAVADLPKEHFKLKAVSLINAKVTGDDLARLKGCRALQSLHLGGTGVTGVGLSHLKECKKLVSLDLGGNRRVTEAGLAQVKEFKGLTHLTLPYAEITDAGVSHLRECEELVYLDLNGNNHHLTDIGVAHLRECKKLELLNLAGTKVTDAGLERIKVLDKLQKLQLDSTQVTDAGLEHLQALKSLTYLDLRQTKVTAKGLATFHAARPTIRIEHDNGVIEAVDVDRKAAEFVLALPRDYAVAVQVNDVDRWIAKPTDLPKERFRLTGVWAEWVPKLDDEGAAQFKDCKDIKVLRLWGTKVTAKGLAHFRACPLTELALNSPHISDAELAVFRDVPNLAVLHAQGDGITDAGLEHFKNQKNLTTLTLRHARVTDAGLAHFKGCSKLKSLTLGATQITDDALALFKECKDLESLVLFQTKVTDKGLANFKNCPNLQTLNLAECGECTDAGLAHFKNCPKLTLLAVQKTKVTPGTVLEFRKAVPGCRIEHDGGVIEPKK